MALSRISATSIADGTVVASEIANYTVSSTKMANTGVTSNTYGNASIIPVFTVDAAGRVTAASNVTLQLPASGVTATTYGGTSAIPIIAIDQQGRITSASNATLSLNSITGNVAITGNVKAATIQETFSNVSISSGNITLDLSSATVFRTVVTAASNIILNNPPPTLTGYSFLVQLYQTGSYAITWPASVQWPANTAPTLSTTSGYVDTIALYTVDGGTNYYGTSVLGQY